jgi:dTDP-glucose 4,6-dehydratase
MRKLKNVLVTGGAGFIGCNFIRILLQKTPSWNGKIINLDDLTYAGNLSSLECVHDKFFGKRYFFEKGNICDLNFAKSIFEKYEIDTVVHFAAESHVDRSILNPDSFIKTNIFGTFNLLEIARNFWKSADGSFSEKFLFHHISTDEVYGSLGGSDYFKETTPYSPRSPYSASKASSDHLAMAYHHTYGLPVTISNCSNNYGPYQFPEKLIPLMLLNMINEKNLPIYGDGKNVRDWLFVEDHADAIWSVLNNGKTGEKYNIGGENELDNLTLLHSLMEIVSQKIGIDKNKIAQKIIFVKDRPGHDRRYAIDCFKIKKELNWKQNTNFKEGLLKTVDWYLENKKWIASILSGEYKNWLQKNYKNR